MTAAKILTQSLLVMLLIYEVGAQTGMDSRGEF